MSWKDEKWLKDGCWISLTREQFEDWVNLDYEPAKNMVGGIVDFVFLYGDNVYSIEEITERKKKDVIRQIELSQYGEKGFETLYIGKSYDEVLEYKGIKGKSFNDIYDELLFLS